MSKRKVDLDNKDVAKFVNRSIQSKAGVHGDCSFVVVGAVVSFYWTPLGAKERVGVLDLVLPERDKVEDARNFWIPESWLQVAISGVGAALSEMSGATPRT